MLKKITLVKMMLNVGDIQTSLNGKIEKHIIKKVNDEN